MKHMGTHELCITTKCCITGKNLNPQLFGGLDASSAKLYPELEYTEQFLDQPDIVLPLDNVSIHRLEKTQKYESYYFSQVRNLLYFKRA